MSAVTTFLPAWKEAERLFLLADYAYGDTVPLDWLYSALGLSRPGPDMPLGQACQINLEFGIGLDGLREVLLREHRIDLQKENSGELILLVPPVDQSGRAYAEGMTALRREVRRSAARIHFVAREALTDAQNAADATLAARFSTFSELLRRPSRLDRIARMLLAGKKE